MWYGGGNDGIWCGVVMMGCGGVVCWWDVVW